MKKIRRPVVKNAYTKANKDKLRGGLLKGDTNAISEALRRSGI